MSFEEKLDQLREIVHTLASSVVAHDNKIEAHDRQIEGLIQAAEAQRRQIADITSQWQAYLNTLPKQ